MVLSGLNIYSFIHKIPRYLPVSKILNMIVGERELYNFKLYWRGITGTE
jgi:hypothetical protein